jgi:hypothetical protein
MIPSITLTQEQFESLVADKVYELPNGYQLKIVEKGDDCTDLNDFDCYGKVKYSDTRPDGFDGSAEKIGRNLWWQPYREGRKVYRDCRKTVIDICEYGFRLMGLQLFGPAVDEVGNSHRVCIASQWISGIEPLISTEYELDLVKNTLLPELVYDLTA